MKTIPFASGLALPLDVVTQKLAFLARSGAGKSYAAGVMIEGLLDAHAQVVVVDPVGVHWALRLAKDGKSAGFSIPVLGGEHGDIPLESTGGAVVAALVAEKRLSLVLDVSDFNGAEQRRFVTDFAVALHKLKKANRSPVMVVWEECQDFVPQRVMGESAKMVGAMERLIKQGRNFGVGTALISQRPQAVNKDVLNQTEVLVVLQTTGPQERKAIEGWVEAHGLDDAPLFASGRSLTTELPRLPIGTAFVWSPQWLHTFKKVEIGSKRTFDASATPKLGAKEVEPRALEAVELEELRGALTATIERAKADDPKELRKQLAEVKRDLAAAKAVKPQVERVEVSVLTEDDRQLLRDAANAITSKIAGHELAMRHYLESLGPVYAKATAAAGNGRTLSRSASTPRAAVATSSPRAPRAPRANVAASPDAIARLSKGNRAVLQAVAQLGAKGVTRKRLTIICGYARSTRDRLLQELHAVGFTENRGDLVFATPDGFAWLGDDLEQLPAGAALREHWMRKLPAGNADVLAVVCNAYPASISREDISARTGHARSTRDRLLQELAAPGLIERDGQGSVRASEELFD